MTRKRWPIIFLLLLLLQTPLPALAEKASIFVYHRFGDARYPTTNIPLEIFDAQLRLLKEQAYTVLPLGEVVLRLRSGSPLPERCAVLTVDDAYETFLSGAMPLLRRYGFPVTLFVSSAAVGHRGYLSWEQLRNLEIEGVEIGNHSATHPYLLNRPPGAGEGWARQEIVGAQKRLARELGSPPRLFAYPFGEYDPELVEMVRELGFAGAVGQQSGVAGPGSDLFVLPRFPMGGAYATLEGFREKLAMKPLPVTVLSPESPVAGVENPPTLVVQIAGAGIDLGGLRCFVQGQPEGYVTADPQVAGRFVVRALQPLSGRRNKYTLTAPGEKEGEWYWFSQLWIYPARGASGAGGERGEESGP